MRIFAAVALLMITACAAQNIAQGPETKRELALWEVFRYKSDGSNRIVYEDKWFKYNVELFYIRDNNRFVNANIASCPVGKAEYSVTDKETNLEVRHMTLSQIPCDPCHKR